VDVITDHYIGYFSWAVPAALLLVIAVALTELPRTRSVAVPAPRSTPGHNLTRITPVTLAAAVAAVGACAAFAAVPGTRTSTADVDPLNPRAGYPTDPALPGVVARMATLAAGRPIVLNFPHDGWTDVTGILVQASRTGVAACVAAPHWAFMMSQASICTPGQARNGYPMTVYPDSSAPPGVHPVARLQRALVTSGSK
jgi:hypothetical protein